MNNKNAVAWPIIGSLIALLALPLVVTAFRSGFAPLTPMITVLRELTLFGLASALVWISTNREHEPLSSLGFNGAPTSRVAVWALIGLVGCVAALAIGMAAVQMFGLRFGSAPGSREISMPLYVTLITVLRAGFVEELFYRGYAIDRLTRLSGSRALGVALPLIVFAGFHYRQGAGGVLIAGLMGAALTALYLWKRNLPATIAAHFLIDFVPNIVLPLLSD